MAIHRVGPLPDTSPKRAQLGRVLVTIDDLSALMDIMRQQATNPGSDLTVQFSGGYFTDAADLHQLSNEEISSLKVHSDNAEVNLEPTKVEVVGDAATIEKIQNTWARTRITNIGTGRDVAVTVTQIAVCAVLVCGTLLFAIVTIPADPQKALTLAVAIPIIAAVMAFLARYSAKQVAKTPGAVIEPMTLHEFRQLQNNNQYPRAGIKVAIVTAAVTTVVALLAIAATLVVSFVNPH